MTSQNIVPREPQSAEANALRVRSLYPKQDFKQSEIGANLDIEELKLAEFCPADGQRLAHMGSWAFNAAEFDYWSSELFQIHGLDPKDRKSVV